ncbi:CHAP domain-containing protein [Actinoplanes sp. CA-252034]|uniref:CHAP domain-containing protein n=1 Tax=Actinoplanes sp. CA-252034 TaxID=3239906 RepID=UPI003D964841
MTNLHTDVIETAPARLRRLLTRSLALGAVAAGAAVSFAVPAHAAGITGYHVAGTGGSGTRVVSDPRNTNATQVAKLADGTALTIDCGVRVRNGYRDTVWHHITAPVNGYVAGYHTDIRRSDWFLRGEATCSTTTPPVTAPAPTTPAPTTPAPTTPAPTTPAPTTPPVTSAPRGATITYNQGYAGTCVFYVLDRFKTLTGVYPKAFGDAKYLADSAASNGWATGSTPRVNSIAIFQGGQNGAGNQYGHAAWVEKIDGNKIYVSEWNFPNPYTTTYRWLTPVSGVKYIYAQ